MLPKKIDIDDKDLAICAITAIAIPVIIAAIVSGKIDAAISAMGISVAAISGLATGRNKNNDKA